MADKLNLGCGFNKIPGFINIDVQTSCEPDQVLDLEGPWPFAENSVEEVRAYHVLEHLGQTTAAFLGIMKELYRVCKPDAKVLIAVPHHNHWTFHADPTHVRKILPEGLQLFDQELNRKHIREHHSNSPLGIYCGVDFVIVKVTPTFDEPWATRIRDGLVISYDLEFAARHYVNTITQWEIELRVRKDPPLR